LLAEAVAVLVAALVVMDNFQLVPMAHLLLLEIHLAHKVALVEQHLLEELVVAHQVLAAVLLVTLVH
jgi:hypothetical protein